MNQAASRGPSAGAAAHPPSVGQREERITVSDEKTLLERLLDPVPAVLWASAGWVVAQFWRRYRARMVVLRWQANHQHLAVSAQDALFGTIEVLYNGNQVHNLFFSTIDLQNQSNTDLANIDLNIVFQDGTTIYMAHGAVQGSANTLPFADPFASELDRFIKLPASDPNRPSIGAALTRRRDFRVPILNRGASLRIAMLVQALPGRQPFVNLACDARGVRLQFHGPQNLVFGVERNLAALTGLALGAAIVAGIAASPLGGAAAAFAAFAVGCVTAALGAAVVRGFRWVGRILG